MASSKLYFKVDCPHCKKAFATVWNDEIEWTTDAKEALQWRGRQNIDMIAAHDGNVAWPEAAALPVTRWSDDWAEQYECPEAVVARQRPQKASDDEWCSWGSAEPPAQPPRPPEALPKLPLVSPPRWGEAPGCCKAAGTGAALPLPACPRWSCFVVQHRWGRSARGGDSGATEPHCGHAARGRQPLGRARQRGKEGALIAFVGWRERRAQIDFNATWGEIIGPSHHSTVALAAPGLAPANACIAGARPGERCTTTRACWGLPRRPELAGPPQFIPGACPNLRQRARASRVLFLAVPRRGHCNIAHVLVPVSLQDRRPGQRAGCGQGAMPEAPMLLRAVQEHAGGCTRDACLCCRYLRCFREWVRQLPLRPGFSDL